MPLAFLNFSRNLANSGVKIFNFRDKRQETRDKRQETSLILNFKLSILNEFWAYRKLIVKLEVKEAFKF